MKPMPVLVAVLALVPLSEAQASLGSPARQEAAPLRVDAPAAPAQGAATENAGPLKIGANGCGLLPNMVSAKAWPSRIATGVRFTRSVTSPTAKIEGTLVCDH